MYPPNNYYFTLSFFPARILLPLILLSLRNFFTVVPLRAAISESVSPFLMVTLLLLAFFLPFLLLRLLREEREELTTAVAAIAAA